MAIPTNYGSFPFEVIEDPITQDVRFRAGDFYYAISADIWYKAQGEPTTMKALIDEVYRRKENWHKSRVNSTWKDMMTPVTTHKEPPKDVTPTKQGSGLNKKLLLC